MAAGAEAGDERALVSEKLNQLDYPLYEFGCDLLAEMLPNCSESVT